MLEWSYSIPNPGRFDPGVKAAGTHLIGDWVSPGAAVKKTTPNQSR